MYDRIVDGLYLPCYINKNSASVEKNQVAAGLLPRYDLYHRFVRKLA